MFRFIGGYNIEKALKLANNSKFIPIFDMAKEGSYSKKSIEQIWNDIDKIKTDKEVFYALKASTFGSHIDQIIRLVKKADEHNIQVVFDAETSKDTKHEDDIVKAIIKSESQVFKTYQMYRRDTMERLISDLDSGLVERFKIVRGAYMGYEKKAGMLLENKNHVDQNYDNAVDLVFQQTKQNPKIKLMIATHNTHSIHRIMHDVSTQNIYFAQLLGMADTTSERLNAMGLKTCKYIPYGDLLEMMPYLVRRLKENYGILKYV